MDTFIQDVVAEWWRDKAASSEGGTLTSENAKKLAPKVAKLIDQSEEECYQVAFVAGLISDLPTLPAVDSELEPAREHEGETTEVVTRHPDTQLTLGEFIRKYWVECDNGNAKALFAKAGKIGIETTMPSIYSAKSYLINKTGWTPPGNEEAKLSAPAVTTPALAPAGGKRAAKGKKNPLEVRIEELQAQISDHEAQIAKLKADIAAIQRVQDMAIF